MRVLVAAVVALGLGLVAAGASADVIDECPDGQRQVIRQGSNGHHGGYECVEEEGCATAGRGTMGAAAAGALGAIVIGVALKRRRR